MKRTILLLLMVLVVATPCLAQEVETDGLFSIEGTQWLASPSRSPRYYAFWEGNTYYSNDKDDPQWKMIGNSFYVNLLGVSSYWYSDVYGMPSNQYRVSELGLMSPLGFGIGIYVDQYFLSPSYPFTLMKVDDNGPSILINPRTIKFDSTETSKTFRLRAARNTNWKIKCIKSWVTLNPDSGGAGEHDINVTVDRTGLYPSTWSGGSSYHARLNIFSGDDILSYANAEMAVANYPVNVSWQIEEVEALDNIPYDSASGIHYLSLALDSNNKPHITYVTSIANLSEGGTVQSRYTELKYATNNLGEWKTEALCSSDNTQDDESYHINRGAMALDSKDNVHILYSSYTNYILPINRIHIEYNGIKYTTNASGEWVTESLDENEVPGSFLMAIDSNDKVHICCYSRKRGNDLTELKYATNTLGEWVTESLDENEVPGSFLMAIDSNDKVHICYLRWMNDRDLAELKYATNTIGEWKIETLKTPSRYTHLSTMALDSKDNVHFSFFEQNSIEDSTLLLKYTTNANGEWVTETLLSQVPGQTFSYKEAMALDSKDNVHICSIENADILGSRVFKYTTNASGEWMTEKVGIENGYPSFSFMSLDSNDKAYISYTEGQANSYVHVVTNNSGEWVATPLPDEPSRLGTSTITIDSNDKVHICYIWEHYSEPYKLKHAYKE